MRVRDVGLGMLLGCIGSFGIARLRCNPQSDYHLPYQPASQECHRADDNSWGYCLSRAQHGTNGAIAYHLHGRNLDEHAWNDDAFYTGQLQQHWAAQGVAPPAIASVSFGPMWLLAPKGQAPASGLLERFEHEVLPAIEARVGTVSSRAVFGESMGGLNALVLALSRPALFSRASALCAPVYEKTPFEELSTLRGEMRRLGAAPQIMLPLLQVAKRYAASRDEWSAISPLTLVDRPTIGPRPRLYVSAGLYDAYGNFEGNQRLVERARKQGYEVEWRPLYGGHCAIDIASLAESLR